MIVDYRKISSSKEAKLLNCSTACGSFNMDLSNVSSTSCDIPRKWNVQTGKLNYLYNSRHRLEYWHVFGDVRAMKRRCYGDIPRWIGDVHGASANNLIIFGNSSAIVRGLPPSIRNHRQTFDLWKYRIFAKHRRVLPDVSLTFTNASPAKLSAYAADHSLRYFHVWLQTNIVSISRAIATNCHIFSSGDVGRRRRR